MAGSVKLRLRHLTITFTGCMITDRCRHCGGCKEALRCGALWAAKFSHAGWQIQAFAYCGDWRPPSVGLMFSEANSHGQASNSQSFSVTCPYISFRHWPRWLQQESFCYRVTSTFSSLTTPCCLDTGWGWVRQCTKAWVRASKFSGHTINSLPLPYRDVIQ